jgi:hypothetical protein
MFTKYAHQFIYFAAYKLQLCYKRIAQGFENNRNRHLKQVIKKLQNSKDYDCTQELALAHQGAKGIKPCNPSINAP